MSSYINPVVRIWAGLVLMLLSIATQLYPHVTPDMSTHVCEYITCVEYFTRGDAKLPIDPDLFADLNRAGVRLSTLVRVHFGDDILLGS